MPSKKKTYSKAQLNDSALLKQLCELTPKNDPARKSLFGLYKRSRKIFDKNMTPRTKIKTSSGEVNVFLKEKLAVLETLEKSYGGVSGRENLNALTKLLKSRTESVLSGEELGKAPGELLHSAKEELFDMSGTTPDPDDYEEYDASSLDEPETDPDELESVFGELGLTAINEDFANIEIHNREWAKEQQSAYPDPKSLRTIGGKLTDDMHSLDDHMGVFEKNYADDLAKPANERSMNILTAKNPAIGVTKPDAQGARAVNDGSWQQHKEEFVNELENQLLANDLSQLQRTIKPGAKVLSKMVTDTIKSCTAQEDEEEEEKRRRIKKDTQFTYAMRVIQLRQLEAEAAKYNDPFAKEAARIAKDHLKNDEMLKAMSSMENEKAERAVAKMELKAEKERIKKIQNTIKVPAAHNAVRPVKLSFAQLKDDTFDALADMLAVQTIAKTIKSYKVGLEDMANEGAGDAMSDDEFKKLTDTMLTEGNITNYSKMIKSREDFKRMKRDIKTPEQLEALKQKALDGSGSQIMDELYKYSREIIRDSTQKAKMEQQKLEQQRAKEMQRNNEPEEVMALLPKEYMDD
ncbi:MAG: hypothetical protein J6O40_04950 [Ruminococcus sp.]|nr:hypothetical protein [Ruminococcus sp.]